MRDDRPAGCEVGGDASLRGPRGAGGRASGCPLAGQPLTGCPLAGLPSRRTASAAARRTTPMTLGTGQAWSFPSLS